MRHQPIPDTPCTYLALCNLLCILLGQAGQLLVLGLLQFDQLFQLLSPATQGKIFLTFDKKNRDNWTI